MAIAKIERKKVYEVAKTIATSVYSKKCCEEGCAKCHNNGDCTPVEIAYQVVGAGYAMTTQKNSKCVQKHAGRIEELAKIIAVFRGYGCLEEHRCHKCICASTTIGCIPLEIAKHLITAGYEKKVEEK